MPVTNYYTVDGQIIGYKGQNGRKDFLTDALGSVTAEVDQSCTKTFEGRYKPYGGDLAFSGQRGRYGYVGTWGYRETGLDASSHYVRGRVISKSTGMWTSVDKVWPVEIAFTYGRSNPITNTDKYGTLVMASSNCDQVPHEAKHGIQNPKSCCNKFNLADKNGGFAKFLECFPYGIWNAGKIWDFWKNLCSSEVLGGATVCVHCQDDHQPQPLVPCSFGDCNTEYLLRGSQICRSTPPIVLDLPGSGCSPLGPYPKGCKEFCASEARRGCTCVVNLCVQNLRMYDDSQYCGTFFHETVHCTGIGHNTSGSRVFDMVYGAGDCLRDILS